MDSLARDVLPWVRMLAVQLRFQPDTVVFLGFPPAFNSLIPSNYPKLSEAHFIMNLSEIDGDSLNATVLENGGDIYCLRDGRRTKERVEVQEVRPEFLLCDLAYLLAMASDDGKWRKPRRKTADAYSWQWTHAEARFDGRVHVWERCHIKREWFKGPVMDNTAAINRNYPDGFLTLGADETGFNSRRYEGGWLRLRFDAGGLRTLRRAFLNVIWPPIHGRGLIGAERSGTPMIGLRLWQNDGTGSRRLIADRQCDILGHYGRFFSQPFTEWQLKIALDTNLMNVDKDGVVEIDLELTNLACLDVHALSLHLFGTTPVESGVV